MSTRIFLGGKGGLTNFMCRVSRNLVALTSRPVTGTLYLFTWSKSFGMMRFKKFIFAAIFCNRHREITVHTVNKLRAEWPKTAASILGPRVNLLFFKILERILVTPPPLPHSPQLSCRGVSLVTVSYWMPRLGLRAIKPPKYLTPHHFSHSQIFTTECF